MDRKKVLLQAIESGFEVTSDGIPCETEYAKAGYALDYVIEGNDVPGGKNLFDSNRLLQLEGWTCTDGVYRGTTNKLYDAFGENTNGIKIPYTGGRLAFSMEAKNNSKAMPTTYFQIIYTDNSKQNVCVVQSTEWTKLTGVSSASKTISKIICGYPNYDTVYLRNIQIEAGSAVTEYESYQGVGVGDLTEDQKYKIPLVNHENGNLFNYTEPKNDNQVKADKDGWFDITIDNSAGTSTVYKNCWTNINPVLKPDTRYYLYTEIAEQSGDIVYAPCSTSANSLSQFKWGLNTTAGYITTISDFTSAAYMLRTYCACTAGKSGHIKFRIAVYETKQDTFTPYVIPQTTEILLDAPLMSGESIRYTSDNLPALPLHEDGNTITVGTTVQPTNLAVTYRAKVR